MLRYLRRLADFDIALDRSMIPLGSCTMKLNAAAEMEPISWPEFAGHAPVRPGRPGGRLPGADRVARAPAGRAHRLRRGLGAAERRLAGRAGRAARHPRLPRLPRRRRPRRLPDPGVGARHQRGQRGAGRAARRGGQVRRRRRRRPRRPAGQAGGARGPRRGDHDHLPVHGTASTSRTSATSARPCTRRAARCTSTGRTSTRWSGWPRRAGLRRRRVAPEPAQDVLHPARRRRPRRRAGGGPRAPGGLPARPRQRAARSRPRPTGRPASCPSPGPTSR